MALSDIFIFFYYKVEKAFRKKVKVPLSYSPHLAVPKPNFISCQDVQPASICLFSPFTQSFHRLSIQICIHFIILKRSVFDIKEKVLTTTITTPLYLLMFLY